MKAWLALWIFAPVVASDAGRQASTDLRELAEYSWAADTGLRPSSADLRPAVQDSTIPLELVQYFLGGSPIRVGVPAEGIDATLLAGGRVLGSRGGGGGRGSASTTIVAFTWERPAALDSMRRRLAVAGWSTPQSPAPLREESGFVTSNVPGFGDPSFFCRNGETTFAGIVGSRRGESVISLTHHPASPRSNCDPDNTAMRMNGGNTLIPRLEPLPGVQTLGGARSSGSDQAWAEGNIVGRVPPAEVLEHYLKQLVANRWTLAERTGLTSIALATFTFSDPRQRPWDGVLTVTTASNGNQSTVRLVIRSAR